VSVAFRCYSCSSGIGGSSDVMMVVVEVVLVVAVGGVSLHYSCKMGEQEGEYISGRTGH